MVTKEERWGGWGCAGTKHDIKTDPQKSLTV